METTAGALFTTIEALGWRARLVPSGRLADLREAIRSRREQGLLDEALCQEWFGSFRFEPPEDLPGARSLLIAAVPTPAMRVVFRRGGRDLPVMVPPTYVAYSARTRAAQALLGGWLAQRGHRVAEPRLPLKTLAVHSGLAEYGRNNVCYVAGMGSFLQLVGAFTDLPCDEDPWREPKALDRCATCDICLRVCPTGAIAADRFLIRAERCLTWQNESPAPFAAWVDPSWHHCLVGCLRCQTACPEDRGVRGWFEERGAFSEHETELLLRATPEADLPAATLARIRALQINLEHPLLCRNLAAVLGRGSRAD